MSKIPEKFPVRMVKGSGKERTARTIHTPIAFRQAETRGFRLERQPKVAEDTPKVPSQTPGPTQAENLPRITDQPK